MRDQARLLSAVLRSDRIAKTTAIENWRESIPDAYRVLSLDDAMTALARLIGPASVSDIHAVAQTGSVFIEGKESVGSFIIMQGTTGVGKTTLALALADTVLANIERMRTGRYITGPSLLNSLSFKSADALNGFMDAVDEYVRPDILVIDDLGVANDGITQHQQRMLWEIIEHRWNNSKKLTIITTNLHLQTQANASSLGLSDMLGPAIWDRMTDRVAFVTLSSASRRG